jgi:hypothetical protein
LEFKIGKQKKLPAEKKLPANGQRKIAREKLNNCQQTREKKENIAC